MSYFELLVWVFLNLWFFLTLTFKTLRYRGFSPPILNIFDISGFFYVKGEKVFIYIFIDCRNNLQIREKISYAKDIYSTLSQIVYQTKTAYKRMK